ncbi:hypothetical protein BJ508DRAFT_303415 [Ascobolus immersus RN42]|uniref:Uncharacterized protein n=1 Tax=Ascobolus immersus RN42 TaxID=1160509 RepID=A0A3N4IGS5_ASCIM|nr:hypothetical protein BJ508DRAFT_303415 [Ascobolus immersus RN42]
MHGRPTNDFPNNGHCREGGLGSTLNAPNELHFRPQRECLPPLASILQQVSDYTEEFGGDQAQHLGWPQPLTEPVGTQQGLTNLNLSTRSESAGRNLGTSSTVPQDITDGLHLFAPGSTIQPANPSSTAQHSGLEHRLSRPLLPPPITSTVTHTSHGISPVLRPISLHGGDVSGILPSCEDLARQRRFSDWHQYQESQQHRGSDPRGGSNELSYMLDPLSVQERLSAKYGAGASVPISGVDISEKSVEQLLARIGQYKEGQLVCLAAKWASSKSDAAGRWIVKLCDVVYPPNDLDRDRYTRHVLYGTGHLGPPIPIDKIPDPHERYETHGSVKYYWCPEATCDVRTFDDRQSYYDHWVGLFPCGLPNVLATRSTGSYSPKMPDCLVHLRDVSAFRNHQQKQKGRLSHRSQREGPAEEWQNLLLAEAERYQKYWYDFWTDSGRLQIKVVK